MLRTTVQQFLAALVGFGAAIHLVTALLFIEQPTTDVAVLFAVSETMFLCNLACYLTTVTNPSPTTVRAPDQATRPSPRPDPASTPAS